MTCSRGCCESPREHFRSIALRMGKPDSTQAKWDRDLDNYKTLREQGYKPRSTFGTADLANKAHSEYEINHNKVLPSAEVASQYTEVKEALFG